MENPLDSYGSRLSREKQLLKKYAPVIVALLVLPYSIYLIFDRCIICQLGLEDGLFESLTAVFFFIASVFFFRTFLSKRNYFFLLLSIVFFLGGGEEIAWGQRLFNFNTPEFMSKINVQNEVTLHNVEMFNAHDFDHNLKSGFAKVLTVNFFYKLFWLGYCVLLPLGVLYVRPVYAAARRMRIPVPPVSIGIFFLANWFVFKATLSFALPPNETEQYYATIGEIRECLSALLFMILSFYFFEKSTSWRRTTCDIPATDMPGT